MIENALSVGITPQAIVGDFRDDLNAQARAGLDQIAASTEGLRDACEAFTQSETAIDNLNIIDLGENATDKILAMVATANQSKLAIFVKRAELLKTIDRWIVASVSRSGWIAECAAALAKADPSNYDVRQKAHRLEFHRAVLLQTRNDIAVKLAKANEIVSECLKSQLIRL